MLETGFVDWTIIFQSSKKSCNRNTHFKYLRWSDLENHFEEICHVWTIRAVTNFLAWFVLCDAPSNCLKLASDSLRYLNSQVSRQQMTTKHVVLTCATVIFVSKESLGIVKRHHNKMGFCYRGRFLESSFILENESSKVTNLFLKW